MQYKIICVGKIKEPFYREEIKDMIENVKKSGNELIITELSDIRIPDKLKESKVEAFLEKECEPMRGRLGKNDYVIALCIEGRELTTKKHKEIIEAQRADNRDTITYIIGGSLGLPEWVKERANLKLSFSRMTFPHQLMRVVLCEEIAGLCNSYL